MAGKKRLTRDQAAEIYDQLRNSMEKRYGKKGLESLMNKEAALAELQQPTSGRATRATEGGGAAINRVTQGRPVNFGNSGMRAAFALVLCVAGLKTGLSALEASGIASVEHAQASQYMAPDAPRSFSSQYSDEEVAILKTLDARRVSLEERSQRLDKRESEIAVKNRAFAAKLTELRELTQILEGDRKKIERKQGAQLDQLANVYGSMNPTEAAQLIEQLDVTISLGLLERMPEKRIGQILAMMSPERALTITRMLSGDKQ